MTTLSDFTLNALDGAPLPLSQFAGKLVMIVNTASKCGLTPQYEGLEALYRHYSDQGLVVLGVPCNQFMGQEPGTAAEIAEFCTLTYDVTFPMLAKQDVNGVAECALYTWLKADHPGDIEWNFAKFLIGRDGQVLERFAPQVLPSEIAPVIERSL